MIRRPPRPTPFPTRRSSELAHAQTYPSRPITIVIGYTPGAVSDLTARTIADGLHQAWAQPRSEEHTSELQSRRDLVCRLLLEKKKILATHPNATNATLTHNS